MLYFIIAVCVLAAIGLIVGFCFGYIRMSFWGGTVVGATLICFVVDKAGFIPEDYQWGGMVMLGVALGTVIVLTLLFTLVRRYIVRQVEERRKLSSYRLHDEKEANDERILIALDKKDKKAYRKYASRRFTPKRGAWGAVDRVFGALTLTINIFAALAVIASLALVVIDSAGLADSVSFLDSVYSNAFWQGQGSALAIDMIIIALMCMCVRVGFNGGILSTLSVVIILGLLGGAGYLAYHLAFNTGWFNDAAAGAYNSLLSGLITPDIQNTLDGVNITAEVLGKIIIAVGLGVILLIPAIIISVFVPRAFDKLRVFDTVSAIDGAIGAAVLTAVVFGVLVFLGALVWQVSDLKGFEIFNQYMAGTHVACGLYNNNEIASLEFITNLPLREWVGLAAR